MAPQIKWLDEDIFETPTPTAGRRATARAAAALASETSPFLRQSRDVLQPVVVRSRRLRDDAVRSAGARPEVALQIEAEPGEEYLLVVKHPSGALTFHRGIEVRPSPRRGGRGKKAVRKGKAKSVIEFRAPIAASAHPDVRRGVFGDFLQGIVDAIIVQVGEVIAGTAVDLAEAAIWRLLGREQGLYRITSQGLREGQLEPVDRLTATNGRALLFLHGTFSTTHSAFADLANSALFQSLQTRYGDAIYGFDHFTVSVSPEENANELLAVLPQRGAVTIDVVTHSRGGLVLRNLVERRQLLDDGARFVLGHAVLVASPNEGTPLATPDDWQRSIGWVANVLDLFPPNPVTSNASMVAHWIAWFVKVGIAAAEGLSAMDVRGEQIRELQRPPKPTTDQYSALVANFEPNQNVLARALDLGIDWFFEAANDLVVPTAGGWRIDKLLDSIAPDRVGCFGPGGNISPTGNGPTHNSFFTQPGTIDFLAKALLRQPQGLPRMQLDKPLPNRALRSAVAAVAAAAAPERPKAGPPEPTEREPARASGLVARVATGSAWPGALELTVISNQESTDYEGDDAPLLLASYDGARVRVPFRTSKRHIGGRTEDWVLQEYQIKELTSRWGQLFATHRTIKRFVDSADGTPPPETVLLEFGALLFETLLPGDVKRLFDVARSREQEKLLIIFTSTIPWVFDMPWEFARDPTRGTFLATEDALFVRNIFTTTPVDRLPPKQGALRLLIATSEPAGLGLLSARQEAADIRNGLGHLVARGLFEIEVRENVTAERPAPRGCDRQLRHLAFHRSRLLGCRERQVRPGARRRQARPVLPWRSQLARDPIGAKDSRGVSERLRHRAQRPFRLEAIDHRRHRSRSVRPGGSQCGGQPTQGRRQGRRHLRQGFLHLPCPGQDHRPGNAGGAHRLQLSPGHAEHRLGRARRLRARCRGRPRRAARARLEPLCAVGRRIGEGRLPHHHFCQQPPGYWPQREA